MNFINFSFSALLGPVLRGEARHRQGGGERELGHYQIAFEPLVWGVGVAIVLTLLLKETGRKATESGSIDMTTVAAEKALSSRREAGPESLAGHSAAACG